MTIINQKKKQLSALALASLFAVLFCTSCIDKFEKMDKYQKPDRLNGKIFTQISMQENMTIFTQFMKDTGMDVVLDKTGTYSAFVPTDSVLRTYLKEEHNTDPANAPLELKESIVKYHILQMPWSYDQLQSLSRKGWISMSDPSNNEPTAFKRKTLLTEGNITYKVQRYANASPPYDVIVPNGGNEEFIVYNETPKYAPLFFDGFMAALDLNSDDYEFYFDRPREATGFYFAGAKMLPLDEDVPVGEEEYEIFAENGFIYTVDRVVEPLRNAEQILEQDNYSKFLQLVHNSPQFTKNKEATQAQDGAAEGKDVDDLYDLDYSANFPLDIHSEIVANSTYTVELHGGFMAPTDDAMDKFYQKYFSSYPGSDWNSLPFSIQRIFVKAHMAFEPIYQKDIIKGFYNANGDIVSLDESTIKTKEYGSNCTFIGLNEAVVPEFFATVSKPLFLDREYSSFFGAYYETGLIYSLKDPTKEFSLFLVDNAQLASDSSLFVSESDDGFEINAWDQSAEKLVSMLSSDYMPTLTRNMYGHIGIQPLLNNGANRQFVETLDGRHIVVENDTVTGGVPSTYGFNGDSAIVVTYTSVDGDYTNGQVYNCNGWLKFPTTNTYRLLEGTRFLTLLDQVGLVNVGNEDLSFLSENDRYTIFVPSDASLASIENLPNDSLKEVLQYHIVREEFVFADGRTGSYSYRTLGGQMIDLNSQPNTIDIMDGYYTVQASKTKTDLIGTALHEKNDYYYTNAVVHHIDTVLLPY